MSRSIAGKQFTVCYKIVVTSIICGHHVYKEVWDATIREMLKVLRMIEKKKRNTINTLLVCTKEISSLDIYQ